MDPTFSVPPFASASTPYQSSLPTFLSPLGSALDRLQAFRTELNLPDPGKTEELGREVKITHLTNYTFDGARADLSKTLCQSPAFQVTHSFAMGSEGAKTAAGLPSAGTYSFGAVYADAQTFLQGMVDQEGGITGRYNFAWSPRNTTKASMQLAPDSGSPSMFSLEHDRTGSDYALSLKTYNPSPSDLTGTYLLSYLQSVSPNLALGVEAVYQKPTPDMEDCSVGYMAKYHSTTKDLINGGLAKDSWIATGQIMSQGLLQGTYWKKLGEKVDAGVEILVSPAANPKDRKATATLGAKWDFRMATFRAQLDSTGKVSMLLEQRLSAAFAFLVAGEMDHAKGTSKYGLGLMIESADESVMQQQMEAQS